MHKIASNSFNIIFKNLHVFPTWDLAIVLWPVRREQNTDKSTVQTASFTLWTVTNQNHYTNHMTDRHKGIRCVKLIPPKCPIPFYINIRIGCLILKTLFMPFGIFKPFFKQFHTHTHPHCSWQFSTVTYMDHCDAWIFHLSTALISAKQISKTEERQVFILWRAQRHAAWDSPQAYFPQVLIPAST